VKLAETLESIRVCDDDKARRVLNVSTDQANITADEIESGVTIERLGNIGVPVFRYSTQVTIHGLIPDFQPEARPMGYKAVFRNQNGSLGVKYVAIDGAKKKLLVQASRLNSKAQFHASVNSQGLELAFVTQDRETALAAFRSFPKELIIGGLYAARGIWGEFFVVADVGAIENANLWPLIGALYGFNSQADLDAAQAAQDAEYAASRAASEVEWEKRRIERVAADSKRKADTLESLRINHRPLPSLPSGECAFISVNDQGESFLYVIRKRGFGLCYASHRYADGLTPENAPLRKWHKWQDRRESMQGRCKAGQLFSL
jgi:hypothetical protein